MPYSSYLKKINSASSETQTHCVTNLLANRIKTPVFAVSFVDLGILYHLLIADYKCNSAVSIGHLGIFSIFFLKCLCENKENNGFICRKRKKKKSDFASQEEAVYFIKVGHL